MEPILSPEEWLAKQPKDEAKSSILSPEDWLAKQKESEGAKQLPQSDDSSDFVRALGNQLPQIQETYGAAKVLTGKALDDKEMMQAGLETMKAGQKKQVSKESDELTKAWEAGIGTVLTDWLPYQAGAGVGSLMETLAMMGIGAGVGAVTGAGVGSVPGAIAGGLSKQLVKKGIREAAEDVIQKELKQQLAEGLTKKEAKEAAKEAGKTFIEAETKKLLADMAGEGAKSAAKKGALAYGSSLGLAGMAGLHGAGEPTSRAIQEEERRAAAEGRQFDVNELDMERLAPAAAVHGLADFIVSKITLGAIKGLPKPSSESFARDVVTHMVKTGGKEVVPEEIQTMAERYGANLSLADAEAMSEYVNTAGAAMVMGAIPGGVGGARTYLAGKQAKNEVKDVVEKDVDTTAKIEDKPAEEVAKETLKDAPTPVAEQAVQSTLNTVPTPELDTKIDAVSTKIDELVKIIEGEEELDTKTHERVMGQLNTARTEMSELLQEKAAAQQTGEATAGQELSALATKIKESEQAPAPASELDAKIAEVENRLATEEFRHPKHRAHVERQLAELKAQRETQDVTQPDTGTAGVGAEVPVGPAVDINAAATQTPAVGGLGEVSGAEPVAVRGPEKQQVALTPEEQTLQRYDALTDEQKYMVSERVGVPRTGNQLVDTIFSDPDTVNTAIDEILAPPERPATKPAEPKAGPSVNLLGEPVIGGKYKVAPTVTEEPAPSPAHVQVLQRTIRDTGEEPRALQRLLQLVASRTANKRSTSGYASILYDLLENRPEQVKLTFSFGKVEEGKDAKFDPKANHITLKGTSGDKGRYTGSRPLDQTILHEILHYLTDHVIDKPELFYKDAPAWRQAEIKAALNRLRQNHKLAVEKFGDKYNIGSIKEFIAEVFTNSDFQRDLSTVEVGKYKARQDLFSRIAETIASILGLAQGSGAALRQSIEDVASIISIPTGELRAESVSYSEPKVAPPLRESEETDVRRMGSEGEQYKQPQEHIPKDIRYFKNLFTTRHGWRTIAKNIQNERHFIKVWEAMRDLAGKIEFTGDNFNAVYTALTTATSKGRNYAQTKVRPLQEKLDKYILEYTKRTGTTVDEALANLHIFLEALHDGERRVVKYILRVPLQSQAADRRDAILKQILSSDKLTKDQTKALRDELNNIVFTKDAQGKLVPNMSNIDAITAAKEKNLDIDSQYYNVTGLSPQARDARLEQFSSDPNIKLLDDIASVIREMNVVTTELNKIGNYWSQPVSNLVNFYGYENYVPLKGVSKHTKVDEMLDFDSERLGKELQDMPHRFEGRVSVSNNPVLQTMSDAVLAALRAGRADAKLTLAIKNAVKQKLINGKLLKHVTFAERQDENFLKSLPRENTIFHYNEDGSIDVIAIYEKDLREAIRRTYRKTNPIVNAGNWATSKLGQMHTRYNYMFAPLNFVRDALTNAWTIGADLGPTKSVKLIGQIASHMISYKTMPKTWQIARAYESKDSKALDKYREMAKKDPAIANILEFIDAGGMVEYLQGVSIKSNFQQLNKDLSRNKIVRNLEGLNTLFDIWTDGFEIASRASAYAIVKPEFKAKFIKDFIAKGMDKKEAEKAAEDAARHKAAAYTKNLANFEQVGKYGKEWGAAFMFFRPAATGAVRAMESMVPAFRDMPGMRWAFGTTEELMRDAGISPDDKAAVARFKQEYREKQVNARATLTMAMGFGAAMYMMSYMMADDDDLGRNKVMNDDMSQWTRYARFHFPGMDKAIQLPWGFGLGAWAALGAQMASILNGQQSLGGLTNALLQVSLDSFIPIPISRMNISSGEDLSAAAVDTLFPSAVRPLLEFVLNRNGLGNKIYNDSNKRMGDAYLGGDNVPEWYKDLAINLANWSTTTKYVPDMDVSPNSLYFFANSYVDGPGRVIDLLSDINQVMSGNKEISSDLARKTPLLGSFLGAAPSVDARQYASAERKIEDMDSKLSMFKTDPSQYAKYITMHPEYEGIVKAYDDTVTELNNLRHDANVIRRNKDIPPKERAVILKDIKNTQNLYKHHVVEMLKNLGVKP